MLGILKSSPSQLHRLTAKRWTFIHELRIACKQWLNHSTRSRGELRSREEKTISWWIQGDWWLKLPEWAGCRECVWVWWRLLPSQTGFVYTLAAWAQRVLTWNDFVIIFSYIPFPWLGTVGGRIHCQKRVCVFYISLKTLKWQQEHEKKSHFSHLASQMKYFLNPLDLSHKCIQ